MTFSASQITTAELCLRKWAWLKIEGLKPPPNKYAAHGLQTHKQVAEWLTNRTPPDDSPQGRTAIALLPHLPPPQAIQARFVEVRFGLRLASLEFVGFVDLFHPTHERRPRVYDHKTTSDLRWAKTPAELVQDAQAILYAFWGMIHSATDVVDLQWTYATRHKNPKTLVVEQTVTKAEIKPRLEKTRDTALGLAALLEAGIPALDVPYDAAGCEAFGGCPFQDKCNLTPEDRIRSVMSQGEAKETFLARLRARQGGQATEGATPHPPPTTPATPAPSAPVAVNPPDPPAVAETPAPLSVAAGRSLAAMKVPEAKRAVEAETDVDLLNIWAEADTRKTIHKAITARLGELGGAPSAPVTAAPAPEPPEPPPAPAPPVSAPVAAATPAQAEIAAMHQGGTSPGFSSPPGAPPGPSPVERALGFTLYVNCGPTKTPNGDPRPELASTRISHVLHELEKATGTAHYKVIDYGKGVGIFAAAVARDLLERPPVRPVIITTAGHEALDCLQAFEAAATTVIHGYNI